MAAFETEQNTEESMSEQLSMLYAEKELLAKELGVSDAHDVIEMVRSMSDQLSALYTDQH